MIAERRWATRAIRRRQPRSYGVHTAFFDFASERPKSIDCSARVLFSALEEGRVKLADTSLDDRIHVRCHLGLTQSSTA